jgi:glycine/D-amino acid oxidase-like deaminating enzyme
MREIGVDVAIIGAGIIGAAAAFELTRRGKSVALLDAAQPTSGTSGSCDGYLSVSTKVPGLAMEMAVESQKLWAVLGPTLGEVGYSAEGGLMIVEDAADLPKVAEHAALLRSVGVGAELRDRAGLIALEPHFGPRVVGAIWCPQEAHVTPYRAVLALIARAKAAGAVTLWNAGIRSFDPTAGRLSLDDAEIRAEQWLIATGIGSGPLGRSIGLELPVIPRRGELIVTERCPALVRRMAVSAKYLTAKLDPELSKTSTDPLLRLGYGFIIERTPEGQHILGSTRTFSGFDRNPSREAVATILEQAVSRVPGLADVQVIRTFAGLRPFVPDKKPLIGRSKRLPTVLIAVGHEGDGITLAPITARIIADLAEGKPAPFPIDALDPDRFTAATSAAA